jgi:hypothetical protein
MNTNSKVALAVTADAALGLGSISAGHRFPPPWSVEEQDGETRADYLRLLSELPADLPTKLFANANRVRLAAGDILFRAGAAPPTVAIASRTGSSRSRWFRARAPSASFLGRGDILSIIDGLPRSATVTAVRDPSRCSPLTQCGRRIIGG